MTVRYRELLSSITRMTDLDSVSARKAAEATLTALVRTLDGSARSRLLDALPGRLTETFSTIYTLRDQSAAGFVGEVSRLARRPPEQARLRAQAVLSALAEQDPELVAELNLPDHLRQIFTPPESGGGVTGPAGHSAPLTEDEFRAAVARLPQWTGDRTALRRVVSLPPENLDSLATQLDHLQRTYGRKPHVRRTSDGLEVVLQTVAAGAVTALDLDLARRVDALILDVGAGIGRS
ncbi:DUF2267 domain-containing protein [Nonomuraea sp. K274]|uniref:Putative pterin-4-alpha-carbinolamine dehydratase n=1 Tax=Nonomuraea cypriaca TaxID=1187855 RepID=A0A931A4K3_9ACTN|nr:DUF2267 domain-containing protein [Nonomuraea cypriaca]MBF8186161.1 DUF2267 domain-containing protein [Nonomuraea cypriaca]